MDTQGLTDVARTSVLMVVPYLQQMTYDTQKVRSPGENTSTMTSQSSN
jgi:hypothetical protein